jgi:Y_Y_Y domain
MLSNKNQFVRYWLLFLFSTVFSISGWAQSGNFFLSNLSPHVEKIDPRSLGMTQDELGVMYFTNKNGILEFDGNNWRLIPAPGSVYALLSEGNLIFAGGSFGFGVLEITTGKAPEFQPIIQKPHIFSTVKSANKIYFCNEQEIFSYSLSLKEMDKSSLASAHDDPFTGLHVLENSVYVTTLQGNLFKVQSGSLAKMNLAFPADEHLLFSIPAGKENIIGTEEGKIYRYKSESSITPIPLADAAYLEHHVLLNAALVGNDLLALGTLRGGVVFVDASTGATKEIIDYFVGLPDNDVTALFTDRNKGVWVAHEYGFTRIAPSLPFRSFNHYPGLSGNLLCVREVDGRLLAGTTLGLFYLKTEEQYDEVVTYVAKNDLKINKTSTTTPIKETATEQKEKSRKRLFGIFRKNETITQPANTTTPTVTTPKKQSQTSYIKQTQKVLKSRQYRYERVDGIDGKVTQILQVNGKTLVAGLGGAFTLNELKPESVFADPVRYVFHSPTLNQLFISTFDDRTVSLSAAMGKWTETHYADTLHDYISYIFEDNLQNIWFCAKTQVYKMELLDGSISSLKAIAIQNPLFDETVGIALGNDTYLAASGTFLQYQPNGQFKVYDSLPGPKKYFASDGAFWFNDGHRWRTLNRNMQSLQLEWLGLFPNLRYLTPLSNGKGFWLVTANNELYQFANPEKSVFDVNYPLFLRDVRGEQVRLLEPKNLRLEQSQNEVHFEFTQPNFTGFRATEFRSRVAGLSNEWSDWSNVNNVVKFSFLPPGQYQLEVQSRDVLGNESAIELVNFEVLPYYWKRWWFYALEFLFFSALVFVSIRLGRKDDRYRVVSQILSMLSVILLIQFIETGISSFIELKSSPVIEFLIQLGIALVVFPIEAQLQKFLQLAKEVRFKGKRD